MKKATLSNTVQLILWVAVIIVVVPVVTNIYFTISKTEDEMCRLSILKHASVKEITTSFTQTEIDCQRKHYRFFEDRVELNNKAIRVTDRGKRSMSYTNLNENIVNQVVAQELYQCWKKTGKGDLNVFNADLIFLDHRPCIICATIDFDTNERDGYADLYEYLETHLIPSREYDNVTYAVYLGKQYDYYLRLLGGNVPTSQHWGLWKDTESALQLKSGALDTEKSYSIFFMGFKPPRVDVATELVENAYYLYVEETNNIPKYCEYIYN